MQSNFTTAAAQSSKETTYSVRLFDNDYSTLLSAPLSEESWNDDIERLKIIGKQMGASQLVISLL